MWPSGRRRSPAKGVGEESSRGFESLRLRHHSLTIFVTGISVDIPAQFQGFTTALCDRCPTSALISAIITAKPQAVIRREWVLKIADIKNESRICFSHIW